jgi:uncharacterized membrane protein
VPAVFPAQAEAYLIDPAVRRSSRPRRSHCVGIAGSWLVYDALCRSPLGAQPARAAAALAVAAWPGACASCSAAAARSWCSAPRSAPSWWRTCFFVIIPGQRELVRAKQQGREPDPAPGLRGKQRSVHNTYFTLPVLFVMISNHYAMTYGARYNWLVLIAISFAGACIRAWFVARHKRAPSAAATSRCCRRVLGRI